MSVVENKVRKAECPNCDAYIPIGAKAKMGQRITCPSCKEELEVVWLHPVELDWAIDEDDFDDEDDDEYDDDDFDYDYDDEDN